MPDRDTTSAVRNAPAKITGMSSRPQLIATARYLSAKIARLLGVKEIPVSELDINWEELDDVPASGLYRAPGLLGDKADVDLDPDSVANVPDPTQVLAHELSHAYTLRSGAATKGQSWVNESMANYIAARLGFMGEIQATPQDPQGGYRPGARFLAWMDEFKPNAGLAFTKLMGTGLISPEDAAKRVTGQPLDYLLAAYDAQPFVADPEKGPFARMLKTRANLDFLGQRAMDTYLRKSKMFVRQVYMMKREAPAPVRVTTPTEVRQTPIVAEPKPKAKPKPATSKQVR